MEKCAMKKDNATHKRENARATRGTQVMFAMKPYATQGGNALTTPRANALMECSETNANMIAETFAKTKEYPY